MCGLRFMHSEVAIKLLNVSQGSQFLPVRLFHLIMQTYLASDTNFLEASNIFIQHPYGEAFNRETKATQCDLITSDSCLEIDPNQLSYKERLLWHFKQFCYKTSSHGIPMLGQAPNTTYRCIWVILLFCCGCMFVYQAVSVVDKYNRADKITDIQLKFDTAPFPAITICNLNPYMDHAIKQIQKIMTVMNVFNNAMAFAGTKNTATKKPQRNKRSDEAKFELANSFCECQGSGSSLKCIPDVTRKPEGAMCMCAYDHTSQDAWPCFPRENWIIESCSSCDSTGYCDPEAPDKTSAHIPCACHPLPLFCVAFNSTFDMLNLWEAFGEAEIEQAEMMETLGYQNVDDEVAIITKAKENLIFAMTELPVEKRIELSAQKKDIIQKCSFNGQPCNIDDDFILVTDPTFGNCFTFNHNRTDNKSSIRAGPMYGLRLLVYVNASDYLPTTEAVGVRITIHDKEEYPFPDSFGYSAPTGYISSFGMKMMKMSRLPAPFGDCIPDGITRNYIYSGYRYSTEGCYRTCFQDMVIRECGCGDPRFPVPGGATHCHVFDNDARRCLERRTNELSDIHGSFRCRCQQPCAQSTYTVSYSAGIFPSESLKISLGNCDADPDVCNEQFQENGAMLEVFFEALNFEMITESEAYGVVKMLSDFGGQLGLWSGVSFITLCEFVVFVFETFYMMIMHYYHLYKKKRGERKIAKESF
ncbi:hypothetical protein AB6A40_000489 [Gnathostoma spinigerum]|uniref:Degenerin mec-4/10 cytosolic domain-containing protein n=1 Tax=Gnathostoma spinigerum TaxID=75299 RepID=A0ABD6E349_9BILA